MLTTAVFLLTLLGAPPAKLPQDAAPLLEALDDERRAEAYYLAVMARHGAVRPFSNIAEAERRHQSLVLAALERRGVPAPPNPHAGKSLPVPARIGEACAEAARLERENVKLYDRLRAAAKTAEVRDLLERLQWMSRERHLPAFERCGGCQGDPGE